MIATLVVASVDTILWFDGIYLHLRFSTAELTPYLGIYATAARNGKKVEYRPVPFECDEIYTHEGLFALVSTLFCLRTAASSHRRCGT